MVYEYTSSLTKILISYLNFQSGENSSVIGRPKIVYIVVLGLIEVTFNIPYFLDKLMNPTKGGSTRTKADNNKYTLDITLGGKESHPNFSGLSVSVPFICGSRVVDDHFGGANKGSEVFQTFILDWTHFV